MRSRYENARKYRGGCRLAKERPKKIQRYSMMMLICIMIIYLVVLCTEVMSSLGAFFG